MDQPRAADFARATHVVETRPPGAWLTPANRTNLRIRVDADFVRPAAPARGDTGIINKMNAMRMIVVALGLTTLIGALMATSATPPRLPQDPRDVARESQLTVTEAKSDLNADGSQELLIAVNALTGESDPARGSEVLYGVAAVAAPGERGPLHWSRRILQDTGKPAHDGELTAVDLDGDGRSELILSWDRSLSSNRVERVAEIWSMIDLKRPRLVWQGTWETDTRRDEATPAATRELTRRDVDFKATRKEAGRAIVFRITRSVEAGQVLNPQKVSHETVRVDVRQPDAAPAP